MIFDANLDANLDAMFAHVRATSCGNRVIDKNRANTTFRLPSVN